VKKIGISKIQDNGGRHIEKSNNRRISADFDKIWHSNAVRLSSPLNRQKFKILKIPHGGRRHLESTKIEISRQRFDRSPQNLTR